MINTITYYVPWLKNKRKNGIYVNNLYSIRKFLKMYWIFSKFSPLFQNKLYSKNRAARQNLSFSPFNRLKTFWIKPSMCLPLFGARNWTKKIIKITVFHICFCFKHYVIICGISGVNLTISFFCFRQEGKFVSSGKDDADHLTIFNIPLQNPEEFQL